MLIMKRIIVFFAVVVQMLLLPCCVEKQEKTGSKECYIIKAAMLIQFISKLHRFELNTI